MKTFARHWSRSMLTLLTCTSKTMMATVKPRMMKTLIHLWSLKMRERLVVTHLCIGQVTKASTRLSVSSWKLVYLHLILTCMETLRFIKPQLLETFMYLSVSWLEVWTSMSRTQDYTLQWTSQLSQRLKSLSWRPQRLASVKIKSADQNLTSRITGSIAIKVRAFTAKIVRPGHGSMKLGIVNIKRGRLAGVTL